MAVKYNYSYIWSEFDKRVLQFNGGTVEKRVVEPVRGYISDPNMPDHIPVSHFEYGHGMYAKDYFKDAEGYEFDRRKFC